MQRNTIIEPNAFLRWAGSKKALLCEINKFLPQRFSKYHEPFLGSAAVFFSLNRSDNCFLSDSNQQLINTYIQIKENVDKVILQLKQYQNNKDFYYFIRNKVAETPIEEAAQFIFINRTCFNGLYRVNKNNQFNVPYSRRENVDFVTEDLLFAVSKSLKNTTINAYDFQESLIRIEENDLVFIDPPYVVSHNENGFIEYNQKIFKWPDQIRLHDYIQHIIDRKAYFILTNAAHSSIKNLYSDICSPIEISRLSKIGGKNSFRGMVLEYLFTNVEKSND